MKSKFSFGLVLALILVSFSTNAQNLLDPLGWTAGDGSVSIFNRYGPNTSNVREMDMGPHGTSVLIWKALSSNSTDNDGGWDTDYIAIDPSKTYRFTVWIRRTGSLEGKLNFGFKALDTNDSEATLNMDGTVRNNPYFEWNPPPTINDWYLLVGYVYSDTHTGGENNLEGIYDTTGTRVDGSFDSFKFANTAIKIRHRVYQRITTSTTSQWLYAPTVYEVNGQEPTIQELINGPGNNADTQAPTAPTLSSTGQSETTVDLTWSGATDNVGVTGYQIYRDGNPIATLGNITSYQVSGLTADTSYSFTVTTLDAAGNESPTSNSASVTTDADSGNSGGNSGTSVWSENNTTASYTGEVAIGRSTVPTGYKLAVEGNVRAREVRVDTESWPDYVFSKDYDLPTLEEIQKHIQEKGHLPNMPSATEVEIHGVELGEMNRLLLEKIEELTLHILKLQEEIELIKKIQSK